MFDVAVLSQRALQRFSAWRGYPRFSRMLAEFPNLEAHLAGGSLRNLLLDPQARVKDYDVLLAGPCLHQAVDWLTREGRSTRGVFGNVHWYPCPDEPLRADLIPVSNFSHLRRSETIADALGQFDFTGNAIAVDLRTGVVLDPVNGIRDMQQRTMRAVRFDQPEVPILPGHTVPYSVTQWFRILHYAAALDLQIEPATLRWLLAHSDYREYASVFTQTFKAPHPNAFAVLDARPAACVAS
jgi:hypothetical protein